MTFLDLIVSAAALGVLVILFWRARELVRRWRHRRSARVLIEDALKHLHDWEYQGLTSTAQSLAGTLGVSGDRATALLATLERRGLAQVSDRGWRLTADGHAQALRVVRVHRLWERFLADETGYDERHWHREADRREHQTSPAEADALDARMGHPQYDPHGDPIPTATGALPPRRGRPLISFRAGDTAVVVHVEDEPDAMYRQLVAEGLHPGQRLDVVATSRAEVRLETEGRVYALPAVAAAHVLAEPVAPPARAAGGLALSALGLGERGRVVQLSPACRGVERRRLMDLGLVPGTVVGAEMDSPGGGVTAYRVRGALIALRREQADHVRVDRVRNGS